MPPARRKKSLSPRKPRGKPPKPAKLRVIGGDLRGRIITYHGADFTRPMKDNIRENLFNLIGPAIRGSKAFDLFSGTGALAIESVSRGAQSAVAVELNRIAAAVIRETTESLAVNDKVDVVCGDAFHLASTILAQPSDDTPWMVYCCPPYALWEDSLDQLKSMIQLTLNNAPPGSVIVAEAEKKFDLSCLPPADWDIREYGKTQLALAQPAMCCGLDLNDFTH